MLNIPDLNLKIDSALEPASKRATGVKNRGYGAVFNLIDTSKSLAFNAL